MWTPFKALVKRDLKLFWTDPRAVLMTIAAPIAIASFFGYLFGGDAGSSDMGRIPVLLVDEDNSAISRDIVARLKGDKAFDAKSSSRDGAREAVRKGRATAAFIFPKDFGQQAADAFFGPAAKPEIAVFYDPSHATETGMARGILTGHAMEAVSKEMFSGPTGNRAVKDSLARLDESTGLAPTQKEALRGLLQSVDKWNAQSGSLGGGAGGPSQGLSIPYAVREEAVTSRAGVRYNGYAHSFGGMGIQFILMTGIEVGVGLLLQRQRGLWKRLRAAPISRSVLLTSRAASAALISMFILLVLFAFARVAFGVRIQGSMAGFLAVCATFSLMTAAFGLLIAALGKTPDATRGLAIMCILLLVMLGGAWVPTFLFPRWMQTLTLAIPTRWAMDGLDAMTWRGLGFSAALGPSAVLLGCAAAFAALAVARFRWEEES